MDKLASRGLNTARFFGMPLEEAVVAEAFAKITVPGRLEVASRRPLVLLDGAHNPAGAAVLGKALEEDFAALERVIVVMGCLRGRDPAELLVRSDVVFFITVLTHEIHQGERVVGVLNGFIVPAQCEPGDAAMVELDKFPVGLGALMSGHGPGSCFVPRRQSAAGRAVP